MALEIERRFLVMGDAWRPLVRWSARLRQGYLVAGGDGLTLRVRLQEPAPRAAEAAWLTLKARPPGGADALTRLEFEYPIPLADGEALLALCGERQLSKWRHGLALPGGDWVLDVFEAANAPLVVAEVELDSADQPLELPPWCVRELSGRHDLSNAALALRPLAQWRESERRQLLEDWQDS
ncbi:MAG: CYTH domain-containing protein [Synechococcaceae cyanobacterium]|nr:CYTH domain-containing protein [Synechococcaceae cyanobacterium]